LATNGIKIHTISGRRENIKNGFRSVQIVHKSFQRQKEKAWRENPKKQKRKEKKRKWWKKGGGRKGAASGFLRGRNGIEKP
jgi:hypothetical protein